MRGEVGEVGTSEVAKAHTKSISILMGTELHLQGRCSQHPLSVLSLLGKEEVRPGSPGMLMAERPVFETTLSKQVVAAFSLVPLMIVYEQYFPVHIWSNLQFCVVLSFFFFQNQAYLQP